MIPALLLATALDLHLDYTRQSLLGTYQHYTRSDGAEVIKRDGAMIHVGRTSTHPTKRVIVRDHPHEPFALDVDVVTGEVVRRTPLFFNAKARVFEVNPVAKLNAPELRDQNNAASAVPDAAYSIVDLDNLNASGMLAGPFVKIVDFQTPTTQHADASQSLMFDRGQPQFEEVNAYCAIDRSQKYLQSLGYTGARQIAAYAVPVDAHALGGDDNSIFESSSVPGQGILLFGDGGTDDAEDPDIVLHEYTHAMQEWIAPGAFFGTSASESRALAEGIADYWSFSQNYVQTVASGRDPYCLADWDARCDGDDPSEQCAYPPGADCLRRLDSTKTMADFRAIDRSGQEHDNSAIWSSALREIFEALRLRHGDGGRQLTDRIVIEAMFGIPQGPTYALMAHNMIAAADALSPGDRDVVCSAMLKRGVAVPDCVPRGEVTLFQSSTSQLVIADTRSIANIELRVDATGAYTLIAPDGTAVTDLASLRGRSAAGTWTLQVQNGTLRAWTLAIQFAGDQRLDARPFSFAPRKHLAAVAHTGGENGTLWITDVRVLNRGDKAANVTAVYTPDAGGFAAVKLVVAPQQVVRLDDVVATTMQSPGSLGALELQGDVADLVVTSRTYTQDARGTFGQFVPSANTSDAIASSTLITHLRNDAAFRSNVGFTEVAGEPGVVRVGIAGPQINVAPFQHVQLPASGSGDFTVLLTVISGNARILGYGSMVDNQSGDAIYIPAPPLATVLTKRTEYAPAISAPGVLGTRWSTEVVVTQPFTAHFLGVTANGDGKRYANVLTELFARDNAFGLLAVDLPTGAIATARIWTTTDQGTVGQFVPFMPAGHGGDLIQLDVSDNFRTNLGAANTSDVFAPVQFTMFDGAGVQVGAAQRLLQPGELWQFPLTVNAARVRVDGNVLAYASVVDNRSGDAIFVPAQ